MGNLDAAILDFLQVVELNPQDEENWSSLSDTLFQCERFDELIECEYNIFQRWALAVISTRIRMH